MPAQASLSLSDGTDSHTFSSNGNRTSADGSKATAEWVERVGPRIGYLRLREQVALKPNANGLVKLRFVFEQPSVTTVDGVDVVAYQNMASLEFAIHQNSTSAEITAFRNYVVQLLVNAATVAKFENLEPTW